MGYSVFPAPAAGSKTRYITTLTSGTSWTVPSGVTYLNVLCVGGGGGSAGLQNDSNSTGTANGFPGQCIRSIVSTSGGSVISYSIGAGGSGASSVTSSGGSGGQTTFTGATSASGGSGGTRANNSSASSYASFANNGAFSGFQNSSTGGGGGNGGGPGWIEIEYLTHIRQVVWSVLLSCQTYKVRQ